MINCDNNIWCIPLHLDDKMQTTDNEMLVLYVLYLHFNAPRAYTR